MKTIIIVAILFVCTYAKSQTIVQDVISSGGGYYDNGNSKLSVTIGETFTDTYSNSNNTITQGFQQSDYNITSIEETAKEGISATVFPNPTTNKINLKFEQKTDESISYVLSDYSGKIIKNYDIIKDETVIEIDFSKLSSGIYFLKVFNKNGDFQKTFKVEKLK
ncbi:MAG: hypothetical protein A2046_03040 [Bacteroidetes bacterium GWA2_30_7]|nr:MAG: hypothetical protein A2046_03040 [Bacteroidetes bacterium GWA2_30_7]